MYIFLDCLLSEHNDIVFFLAIAEIIVIGNLKTVHRQTWQVCTQQHNVFYFSYPVLAQIPPGSASGKPPLPPVPYLHLAPGSATALAQPPGLPSQAWYRTETPVSDLQARQIPRPPSTVMSCEDSQAAPTGRSRREEKLAEEW